MEAKTYFDAEKKLWRGEDALPLYNPQASIGEVLLKAFTVYGSNVVQISLETDNRVTYEEMKIKTIRAAQNIEKLGYKAGEVISFVSKNTESLFPIIFASFCIGCPINVLAPKFGKTEISHVLKRTKPALLFCSLEAYELVNECMIDSNNNAKIFTFGGKKGNSEVAESLFRETGDEANFRPTRVSGVDDCAAIICSSGTTDLPKGIRMSHASIINGSDFTQLTMNDVFFCFCTMNWATSLRVLLNSMLHGGTHIITAEYYSTEVLIRLIETYKITFIVSVPQQAIRTFKSDLIKSANLSSIKYYYIVGSTIPRHLAKEMKKYLPNGRLLPAYGMTEVTRISMSTLENYRDGSVGQLRKRVTVKIVDQNGRSCGINEIGEIFVKPYFNFLGYFNHDAATKKLYDQDGFICTADVGYFDTDGFLYVVDRNKDLIRYRGGQISPSEIENFLIKEPGIKSVCVVGISDEINSELPTAVIVRINGSTLDEQKISDMVFVQFGDFKKLRGGVYFVDSLPTTSSGKIIRREVRELATELYENKKLLSEK